MLRFVDSCLWVSSDGLAIGPALKYINQSTFGQIGTSGTGRFGPQSYSFTNSGFGQIVATKPLDAQNYWYDSRSLYVLHARNPESIIWRWQNSGGPIAAVTLGNDGKLRIYAGGDGFASFGGLIYTSRTVLALDTWYSVDFAWSFPNVGTGTVSLYINDVLDAPTGQTVSAKGFTWNGVPDSFSLCWGNLSSTGYLLADLVVNDGTGANNNARLGPCRVNMYIPCADQRAQWQAVASVPVAGQFGTVNETPLNTLPGTSSAPDGNYSYITAASSLLLDLFTMGRYVGNTLTPGLDCYASVLGVALSVCLQEPTSGWQQTLAVWPNPSSVPSYTSLGSPPSPRSYGVVQGISETNPATGAGWTDGDLGNAWWGVVSGAGTPRVTQIVLEKVTTLRNVPYNCGGVGSYAYGKGLT